MEDLRSQNGLVCMANCMTEIQQVSQSALTLISRNNASLDSSRPTDKAVNNIDDWGQIDLAVNSSSKGF